MVRLIIHLLVPHCKHSKAVKLGMNMYSKNSDNIKTNPPPFSLGNCAVVNIWKTVDSAQLLYADTNPGLDNPSQCYGFGDKECTNLLQTYVDSASAGPTFSHRRIWFLNEDLQNLYAVSC